MDTLFEMGFGPGDRWSLYGPAEMAPASGIYRCDGCDQEIAVQRDHPLPASGHHSHRGALRVQWRLVMKTGV